MTIRSESGEAGDAIRAHSNEVFEIHERMLAGAQANSRYIELRSGRRPRRTSLSFEQSSRVSFAPNATVDVTLGPNSR
jgi:hypothetical protein